MRFIFSRWNKFLFYERCFQVVHEQDFRDSSLRIFTGVAVRRETFSGVSARQWDCKDPSGTLVKNWFRLRRSGSSIYTVTLNVQPLQEFHDSSHLRGSIFRVIAVNVLRISTKYFTWDTMISMSRIIFLPLKILLRFPFKLLELYLKTLIINSVEKLQFE